MKAALFYPNPGMSASLGPINVGTDAVDYLALTGGSGGFYPRIAAVGPDVSTGIDYWTKGASSHVFYNNGVVQFKIASTSNAVNFLSATGSISGSNPTLIATGSDAIVGMTLQSKGAGYFSFVTNNAIQFSISNTTSSVNYINVTGGVAGGIPTLSAQGADANISLSFAAKGTAQHQFWCGGTLQMTINGAANAVNCVYVNGSATGGSVVIGSSGTDANININIAPKGAGLTYLNNPRIICAVPATALSPGVAGQIAYDAGFIYVCTAANTWVRAALATF